MRLLIATSLLLCAASAMADENAAPAPSATSAPAASPTPAPPSDPNLPIAKVGDGEITVSEFGRFARFRLQTISAERGTRVQPDARFRSQVLTELIAGRVLEILAKEANIAVSDEDVEKDFSESKKNFKTPEEYAEYLRTQSTTEEALRADVRRKLTIDRFIAQKTGEVSITPQQVEEQYNKLKEAGRMNRDSKTADLAQIVALFDPKDEAKINAAKEKIEAIRTRIVNGENFEEVGKQLSKDPASGMQMGLIDEARPAALFPDIAKALEQLKPGEISPALKTPRGYGIVLVKAWYEPGTIPLEKVSKRIEGELRSAREQEIVAELVKTARERIPIEIYKANPAETKAAIAPTQPTPPPADTAPAPAPAAPSATDLDAVQ